LYLCKLSLLSLRGSCLHFVCKIARKRGLEKMRTM
jgi:hypothetical protein